MATASTSKKSQPKAEGKVNEALAVKVRECVGKVGKIEYQLVAVLASAMTRKTNRLTIEDIKVTIISATDEKGTGLANVKPAYAQDFPLVVELFALKGGAEMPLKDLFNLARDLRAKKVEGKTLGTKGAKSAVTALVEAGESVSAVRADTPRREVKKGGARSGSTATRSLDSVLSDTLEFLESFDIETVNGKQSLLIQAVLDRLSEVSSKVKVSA